MKSGRGSVTKARRPSERGKDVLLAAAWVAASALAGCGGQSPELSPSAPSSANATRSPGIAGVTPACGGRVGPDGQLQLPGKVEFEYFKTDFQSGSSTEATLQCVVDFLNANPSVKRLTVSDFMDDTGNAAASTRLSKARAQRVLAWLVAHGVGADRLSAEGYGPTQFLVPNDTQEHRLINRRVTFHVEDVEKGTASAAQGSSAPVSSSSSPSPASPSLVAASPQPTAYAVVVGIERYSAGLPPPIGAHSDAQRMAEVFHTSLGISTEHIQVLLDEHATKGAIEGSLAWAKASTPSGGRVYFYFSGHGSPDATNGASYIVPTDGDPRYLDATAISLHDVLAKLGQTKAREVVAMVDSCFSGAGGRSVLPPGARPLVRVHSEGAPPQIALFSASGASEISGPVPGGSGGLFTSYLVEGLGHGAADVNGDGQVSLGELSEWVSPRVARAAQRDNRAQNPSLVVGQGLGAPDALILEWGLPAR